MNFGFTPDPLRLGTFAPIWYVPKYAQSARDWEHQITMFEALINNCSSELQKMMNEWTAKYLH